MKEITIDDIANPMPTVKAKHVFVRVFTKTRLIPLGVAIIFGLIGLWVVSIILALVTIGLASKAAQSSIKAEIQELKIEAARINNEIDSQNISIETTISKLDEINNYALDYFTSLTTKLEDTDQHYEELERLLRNEIVINFWEILDEVYQKFDEFSNTIDEIEECEENFNLAHDEYNDNKAKINKTDEQVSHRIDRYKARVIPDPPSFIIIGKEFPDALTPYEKFQKIHDEAMLNVRFQDAFMRWEDRLYQQEQHREQIAVQREAASQAEEAARRRERLHEASIREQQRATQASEEQAQAAREQAQAAREQTQISKQRLKIEEARERDRQRPK